MKENMLKLKNDLKELAKELRKSKQIRNESFRNKDLSKAGDSQYQILNLKHDFRHKHITYCLLRGKEYSNIEPIVREGNEPDWHTIKKYMEKFGPNENQEVA